MNRSVMVLVVGAVVVVGGYVWNAQQGDPTGVEQAAQDAGDIVEEAVENATADTVAEEPMDETEAAATEAARQTAAMIDGFWLRSALSLDPAESFEAGERLCKQFVHETLARAGA